MLAPPQEPTPKPKPCGTISFSHYYELDSLPLSGEERFILFQRTEGNSFEYDKVNNCYLEISISKTLKHATTVRNLEVESGRPGESDSLSNLKNSIYYANNKSKIGYDQNYKFNCVYAVCFRYAALYEFDITVKTRNVEKLKEDKVTKIKSIDHKVPILTTASAILSAPHDGPLGVLYFWRKAFVKNKTTATFENGMLTGLTVDNPSQIEGFLSLPIELLKAVPILIAVN